MRKGFDLYTISCTMTLIYQSTKPPTTYWTLPKFLSRSQWRIEELTSVLLQQVQAVYSKGVYVYDETLATRKDPKQNSKKILKIVEDTT